LTITTLIFFYSSRRRHTRFSRDWSSDVCSSDLEEDASDVARELEALLQDWRAHLENAESVLIERIRAAEERDVDREEAMLRAFEIGRASCRERVGVEVGGGR